MERAELDQWRAKEVARLLALVETERRYYQDIVAALPIGLLVVSADLRVISANRAFRRTFNLQSEQVLRQRIEDVLPLEGLTALIDEVIVSGGTRPHIVYEPESTPGGRYLRVSITSVRDWEEESDREALLLVEDLSDIRAALVPPGEPELEELPAAPEEALAIRWESDAAGLEVRPLDDGLAALFGYTAEEWEAPGFWWRAVEAGDAGWVGEFLRRAAAEGEIRQCDHRMRAADGRTVWVRSVIRPVRDDEGGVRKLNGVTIDITAARERERQLAEARTLDAMALWSGRLTHDFNNLLMIVTGYSREILDSLPARDPRRGDLQEILRTAERVSGMVRELMTLSRPPIPELQQVDLGEAVRGMEGRLGEIVAGKAALSLSLDPAAGLVTVDPAHLETMVTTLVKQAAQVAGAGARIALRSSRVEVGARYASPEAPPRSCVKLEVCPENVTVDAETREHLFEPLLGIKEPELAPGLFPICGIVRQAAGELRVEQEPGGGTVFALYLPRVAEPPGVLPGLAPGQIAPEEAAPEEVAPAPVPEAAAPAEAPPEELAPEEPAPEEAVLEEAPHEVIEIPIAEAAAETVLVVEDDPGIRALMRKILHRQGFMVLEAASGQESLELAREHPGPIQLLITDLMMPEMSGREVSERLRETRPDIKVVFVSGYTDDPMIKSGQLPEGTAFLQKPFTLGALLDKVREALGRDAPAV
jgi:PAS domain S-box-containing protein